MSFFDDAEALAPAAAEILSVASVLPAARYYWIWKGRAAPQSFIESRTFFTCCENSCMMTVSSPMISGRWGLSTR